MKHLIFALLIVVCSSFLAAQVTTTPFSSLPEETVFDGTETLPSFSNGVFQRATLNGLHSFFFPNINITQRTYNAETDPIPAVDYEKIITDNQGVTWFIDADGDAVRLGGGTDNIETATELPTTPIGNFNSPNVQSGFEEHQFDIDNMVGALGITFGQSNMGSFTADFLPNNASSKTVISSLANEILKLTPEIFTVTASTTSISTSGGNKYHRYHQIDMSNASTASPISLAMTTTIILPGSTHTFHFINTQGNHDITTPSFFLDMSGIAIGTLSISSDKQVTCYFDGTFFNCEN